MGGFPFVARRLKEARKRRGLSQSELGLAAGMDPASAIQRISQYERGIHTPDSRTTGSIARVLRVPTAFFYADDDGLAAWILAYPKISPAARNEIIRKAALEG